MIELSVLSDDQLENKLRELSSEERQLQIQIIIHLREVERRLLYAKRGYSSLYDYCIQKLGFSEGSAYRRIASMRLIREIPETAEQLHSGALNMTTATLAHQFFRRNSIPQEEKKRILQNLQYKTKRQAEQFLNQEEGVAMDSVTVRLLLTVELRRKLEITKQSLRLPENTTIEQLLETLVDQTLQRFARRGENSHHSESLSRYIPARVKMMVWRRDEGTCSYQDPESGRRCVAKYALQYDHIVPFSAGGKSIPENLRLLCPAHNQLHAVQALGEETMQKFLEKLR